MRRSDERSLTTHAGSLPRPAALLDHYADAVGPERVIAGPDCRMGGRVSSDIAWAKLASLVEGAQLASERL